MSSENHSNMIKQFYFSLYLYVPSRLMLIVMLSFLHDIYLHVHVYVVVDVCARKCGSQWRIPGVLLCHSPSYSLETRSLTEPGAPWFDSKSVRLRDLSSLSLLYICRLQMCVVTSRYFYMGAEKSKSGPHTCTANALTNVAISPV